MKQGERLSTQKWISILHCHNPAYTSADYFFIRERCLLVTFNLVKLVHLCDELFVMSTSQCFIFIIDEYIIWLNNYICN